MTDDVMEFLHGKRSLRDMVDGMPQRRQPAAEPEPKQPAPVGDTSADDWILLPAHGSAYQARSRPSTKPIHTLHLLLADCSSKGFAYANLDTIDLVPATEPGKGPVLVLRFAGIVPQEVRIFGRRLETIRDYVGQHRLAWIQVLKPERDFLRVEDEAITRVEIKRYEG